MTREQKGFVILPVIFIVILVGVVGYFIYQNLELGKEQINKMKPALTSTPFRESIILKIPIIGYKVPGNKLTEVIITGYQDREVTVGEEFVINPATLGYLYESSVGDIKLKLIELKENSIIIDVLADETYDGSFFPRNPVERKEIIGTKCLKAWPLVVDVSYEYCFTYSKYEPQPSLNYIIKSRSTMPLPSN